MAVFDIRIPSENLPDVETVSPALRSAVLEGQQIQTARNRGSTQILSVSNALGCDVVLGSMVDQLWSVSINKSTRTVYEASFRAIRRFSYMYPS